MYVLKQKLSDQTSESFPYLNISENMVVYPNAIKAHLMKELPFMATVIFQCKHRPLHQIPSH